MQKNKRKKFTLTIEIVNNLISVGSPEYQIFKSAGFLLGNDLAQMYLNVGMTAFDIIQQVEEISKEGIYQAARLEEPVILMKEAQVILGVSHSTLKRMIKRGEIECKRSPGGIRQPLKRSVYAYKKKKEGPKEVALEVANIDTMDLEDENFIKMVRGK